MPVDVNVNVSVKVKVNANVNANGPGRVNAPNGAGLMTSGWRRSVTFNPLLTLCMPLGTIDRLTSKPDVFPFAKKPSLKIAASPIGPIGNLARLTACRWNRDLDDVSFVFLYSVLVGDFLAPESTAEERF